jgi:hypothetical protein
LIGAKNPPNENLTIGSIPLESSPIAGKKAQGNSPQPSSPTINLHPIVQPFFEAKSCQSIEQDQSKLAKYCRLLQRISKTFKKLNVQIEHKVTNEPDKDGILFITSKRENGKIVISTNVDPMLSEKHSNSFMAELFYIAFEAINKDKFKRNAIKPETLRFLVFSLLSKIDTLTPRQSRLLTGIYPPTRQEEKQFKEIMDWYTALVPVPKGK